MASCAFLSLCEKGSEQDIINAINGGADVNIQDEYGSTALMYASDRGNFEAVKVLIEAGADVNAQNNDGWSALMYALYRRNFEVAKVLIEAGADVNARNNGGLTALMHASDRGSSEAVKALIEAGADINARDENGKTAFMHASDRGRSETVKVLIEAGADVNARDNNGKTALTFASDAEAVELLIETGADVNSCDLANSDIIKNLFDVEDDEDENAENEDNGVEMKQAMKAEAVERMKLLGLPEKIINEFQEKSVIYVSESVKHGEISEVYRLNKDDILFADIREFEKEYRGSLVYHVIRDSRGKYSYGDIDSFLNVFPEPSEWDYVKKVFKTKKILMDVYAFNRTIPEFSDYGEILVEAKDGGLLRMS